MGEAVPEMTTPIRISDRYMKPLKSRHLPLLSIKCDFQKFFDGESFEKGRCISNCSCVPNGVPVCEQRNDLADSSKYKETYKEDKG